MGIEKNNYNLSIFHFHNPLYIPIFPVRSLKLMEWNRDILQGTRKFVKPLLRSREFLNPYYKGNLIICKYFWPSLLISIYFKKIAEIFLGSEDSAPSQLKGFRWSAPPMPCNFWFLEKPSMRGNWFICTWLWS